MEELVPNTATTPLESAPAEPQAIAEPAPRSGELTRVEEAEMELEAPIAYSNMPKEIAIPEIQPKAGPLTRNGIHIWYVISGKNWESQEYAYVTGG